MLDLVVVGGGPAGLAAARAASEQGASVLLLEKAAAFGEPVRTSGGSFIKPLRELGIPSHLWHPVPELRFVGPHHDMVFGYRRPRMCVLDIRGLYQWLAGRAAAAGAELHLKEKVLGAIVEDGRVVGVRTRNGEHRARLVIDASGNGVLGRDTGARGSAPRQAVGLEVEVFAPRYDQRQALLVVGDAVAPGGYGWAFPRGDGRVRLGVGVVRPISEADLEDLMAHLVERVPALRDSCEKAQPVEMHAGVMPAFAYNAVPLSRPGLLLAGDAAGQGSTLLGEGIRHAIVAGKMAGTVAGTALRTPGEVSEDALKNYPDQWDALVGRQMRVGYELHQRLCDYRDAEWTRALGVVEQLSRGVVIQALAGDVTPGWALKLLLRHPRVILSQGRNFLRAGFRR